MGSGRNFFSKNASRNMRGCVQGKARLLPRISCWNKATAYSLNADFTAVKLKERVNI